MLFCWFCREVAYFISLVTDFGLDLDPRSFSISEYVNYGTIVMRTAKTLIRLGRCPDSEAEKETSFASILMGRSENRKQDYFFRP